MVSSSSSSNAADAREKQHTEKEKGVQRVTGIIEEFGTGVELDHARFTTVAHGCHRSCPTILVARPI
jgi:hypothetical protein